MSQFNKKSFEQEYYKIQEVNSPFFNSKIRFNSIGLHHLYNNGQQNQRSASELELRCCLVLLVPVFLSENITPSTFRLREYKDNPKKWEKYWSFVVGHESRSWGKKELKDDNYIKFLVRETDSKSKHFYSVMLINANKKSPEGEIV